MIGTFNYIGCYKDLINNVRTLGAISQSVATMTLEACATFCYGYDYFGTEYGRECYCGYTLDPTVKAPETDCVTPCLGNTTELCGTGSRLSVYQNTIYYPPPTPPAHVPSVAGYKWQSCWSEPTAGRALSGKTYADIVGMTVESCAAFCTGYAYFGVEYRQECEYLQRSF